MRRALYTIATLGLVACLPATPDVHLVARDGGMPTKTDDPGMATCGAQTFTIPTSVVPPNVFLLVDRSGSMSEDFGGGAVGTKWDAAQNALNGLLANNDGKAAWGLSLFPPNPSVNICGKAVIDVSLGQGNEAAVLAKINELSSSTIGMPRGSTPTADALETVRDQARLSGTDRENFVVLVTDGIPQCNSPTDVGPVIDELYNRTPSVKTFVVGIGAETASNPTLLNQWAEKGHTARANQASEYYQADDAAGLIAALDAIIVAAASCTYTLADPPSDPGLVVGRLDGKTVAKDPANGFSYVPETRSITFHGSACDSITRGAVKSVDVVYGCPPVIVL